MSEIVYALFGHRDVGWFLLILCAMVTVSGLIALLWNGLNNEKYWQWQPYNEIFKEFMSDPELNVPLLIAGIGLGGMMFVVVLS